MNEQPSSNTRTMRCVLADLTDLIEVDDENTPGTDLYRLLEEARAFLRLPVEPSGDLSIEEIVKKQREASFGVSSRGAHFDPKRIPEPPDAALPWRADAERWRALIGCARITAMGSAGLDQRRADGYAHVTLNFWTRGEHEKDSYSREWLRTFADIARASATKPAAPESDDTSNWWKCSNCKARNHPEYHHTSCPNCRTLRPAVEKDATP